MVVNEAALNKWIPRPVQDILESSHEFHLTGSRFFGRTRPRSDWDFFAQDCASIHIWLGNHGFEKVNDAAYYPDPSLAAIYLHSDGCHVQLVKDVTVKIAVQNLIHDHISTYCILNRVTQRQLWRSLMPLMAQAMRKE